MRESDARRRVVAVGLKSSATPTPWTGVCRRIEARGVPRGWCTEVVAITSALMLLTSCSAEKRPAEPSQPQTAPNGPSDPRIADFENSAYQLSQGGRYFSWYGCSSCHSSTAQRVRNMADGRWANGGSFEQVYRSITAHPDLKLKPGESVPAEQLWQLTAYVRSLNTLEPAKRRRQDFDQAGEPQGDNWSGPVE